MTQAKSDSDVLIKREDESGKNTLEHTLLQQSPPNVDELSQCIELSLSVISIDGQPIIA
ncbi:hypothetical protein JCM19053_358 [Vibrio sp. JCM 19053]|nr:hypothetical protein JCM19053_358 [Vibrio sp. JCM 19053]